jgi:hypothetical protein
MTPKRLQNSYKTTHYSPNMAQEGLKLPETAPKRPVMARYGLGTSPKTTINSHKQHKMTMRQSEIALY